MAHKAEGSTSSEWDVVVTSEGDGSTLFRLPYPGFDGWTFELTLDAAGRLRRLTFDSSDAITARRLRDVPVGELVQRARSAYAAQLEGAANAFRTQPRMRFENGRIIGDDSDEGRARAIAAALEIEEVAAEFRAAPRPGSRGRDDLFYALLAKRYAELCRTSRTPMKDLAVETGFDTSQLRNFMHEARSWRRGLLTGAPDGQAGGELTDKALDIIRRNGER